MLPYEIFFYGGIFFLMGVLTASLGVLPLFVTGSTFAICGLFILFYFSDGNKKNLWVAGLFIFIIAGSVYYRIDDARFNAMRVPFGQTIEFSGVVLSDPVQKDDTQEMRVVVFSPFHATILVKIKQSQFAYGDAIKGSGIVEKRDDGGYGRYLEGQYIRGTMSFPSVEKISEGNGSSIKSMLLGIKHKITSTFTSVLPPEEATFLAGLTVGARGLFSPELTSAMQKSGTTHLVALSGQNISILVFVIMTLLLALARRRTAFIIATLVIIGFVIMTGADASVVRAAIVGFIVLLAKEVGRAHDIRNVILCACVIMVLLSPKTLAFDVGFQLSFLALLGIVYINPIFMRMIGMKENEDASFFSWKTYLITTASAQLATMPILIASFGYFSPIALISNVAILEFIPMTMALGFLTALFAPISYYLSLMVGLLTSVFLKFELFLIYFFARISFPLQFKISVLFFIMYYCLLGMGLWWVSRAKT